MSQEPVMPQAREQLRAVAKRALLAGAGMTLALLALPALAQNRSDTERKLEHVQRELKEVAAERRRIEGDRGAAARQLRQADEQVGRSHRALRATQTRLARDQQALAQLRQQREATAATREARRAELARLLRAAYVQGEAAPLKALLAPDRLAEANRTLAYQRYLQHDRARRIAALSTELQELETLEAAIVARQEELDRLRRQQQRQLGQLERDRRARAALVARLDARYQDRRSREQALGRDAQGLERLLARLRAAAVRAEAQRRAAAAKAARDSRQARAATRAAAPVQVGGLGWPLSGALLAGFGGTTPDGRDSQGLLIAAKAGTPVKAVADGAVVYAEWMTGYGLLLIVDHGNGYMSLYAHNDALLRDVGARVKRGDAVATVGSSGGLDRPALYFELRRDGQPVNPASWLRR